ncbi:cytochrome P450 [Nocardia puris]|uniref:Cytochrome P450 n=1 Tax=Nocardia puris TaxID=208602 RepID=A0A366DQM9_9NOCA|nr:cytochrome P450 [Nocardia puris]MBF6211080.1 cytochrome P450 [Nocardia puris]MBF6364676.1 cytochrome P450 [Nocardia puris]MBF6463104.1 cytochrome P450 [Nocardia puris]RBO92413.1 cytochrome P450 [Nocardia puris]
MKHLSADYFRAPHDFTAGLRAEGPVHQVTLPTGARAWLVVGYDEALEVLRHPDIRKNPPGTPPKRDDAAVSPRVKRHLLNTDPPEHSRLRRLVTPAFAPSKLAALAPRVEAVTDELLERIGRADRVDLLEEFAFPLPIIVICEMLGVPARDRPRFREWSTVIVDVTKADASEKRSATDAFADYLDGLIDARREDPRADMISDLVAASDDGGRLTRDELVAMVFLILVAGHETTVNLLGNAIYTLLDDPRRYRALRADPGLVAPFVEEILRYDGPVNFTTVRFTATEVTIGGATVPEGELVLVAVGSANRDERKFPDGKSFDPGRGNSGHIAFGHGIHYCLGAGLARLETRIALDGLARRYPDLRLAAGDLRWRESLLIRGLHSLPVHPHGAPSAAVA